MVRLVLAEEKLKLILCRPLPPGIVRVGLLVGKVSLCVKYDNCNSRAIGCAGHRV